MQANLQTLESLQANHGHSVARSPMAVFNATPGEQEWLNDFCTLLKEQATSGNKVLEIDKMVDECVAYYDTKDPKQMTMDQLLMLRNIRIAIQKAATLPGIKTVNPLDVLKGYSPPPSGGTFAIDA